MCKEWCSGGAERLAAWGAWAVMMAAGLRRRPGGSRDLPCTARGGPPTLSGVKFVDPGAACTLALHCTAPSLHQWCCSFTFVMRWRTHVVWRFHVRTVNFAAPSALRPKERRRCDIYGPSFEPIHDSLMMPLPAGTCGL